MSHRQAWRSHQCPLSLEDVEHSACVLFCFHGFCSACIQHWARQSAMCPLCRQLFQLSCAWCQQPATLKSTWSLLHIPYSTTATAPGPEGRHSAQLEAAPAEHICQLGVLLALALNKHSDAFQGLFFFFIFNTRDPPTLGNV